MTDLLREISTLLNLLRNGQVDTAVTRLERLQSELIDASNVSETQTVLVLDDNIEFLELMDDYLRALGHQTLLCTSLQVAREVIASNSEANELISFALLDIMVRTEHGNNLIPDLQSSFPDIKIIFISGHAPEQQLVSVGMPSVIGVLQKPFGLSDLKSILS